MTTSPSAVQPLAAVAATIRAEGGLLATALTEPTDVDGLGAVAARGPRSDGREEDVSFVIEAIREGHLLHYGRSRLFALDDADLALLAGDRLYALGLERLAELGDLEAVAELADVISLCAQANAEGDLELATAAWEAGAAAVGWGATAELRAAKAAARAREEGSTERLRAAARQLMGAAAAGL